MGQLVNYRELFQGIETMVELVDGSYVVPINFDNAATTPSLKQVDEFVYQNIQMYGSVGRGGHKNAYCTEAYNISRKNILEFFNLNEEDGYTTIYVKNTTEGLNLLSNIICKDKYAKVLSTRMEHHANDLPWRYNSHVFYVDVDEVGRIHLEDIEEKLKLGMGSVKYVTVTGASNVTGYINPIHKIAKIAHKYGAKIIVDAAQLVAHRAINMKGYEVDDFIDFLVFSGHKMYAPFGSGVVIGPKKVFEEAPPYLIGGGMVTAVFDNDVYFKMPPEKDEAGTPNFLGAMAIVASVVVLKEIGFDQIQKHEDALRKKLIKGLKQIPGVILYGNSEDEQRVGVVTFNIKGMTHDKVSKLLTDKRGIAVRNGCFCAQPYVARLLGVSDKERYMAMQNKDQVLPGMVRASFALYNTEEEVEEFLNIIENISLKKK